MSNTAYQDKSKTILISAKEATYKNNKHYYCKNKECCAILYLRNSDGIKSAHFCAYAKHPHIHGCYEGISNFKLDNFKENEFNFDESINNLSKDGKSTEKKTATELQKKETATRNLSADRPLKSLREIYYMCKSKKINDKYSTIKISHMLADERTMKIYQVYGPIGVRIVECTYIDHDSEKNQIFMDYYGMELTLNLNNRLFEEINEKLHINREHKIAICGDWSARSVRITSKRQIYIIK